MTTQSLGRHVGRLVWKGIKFLFIALLEAGAVCLFLMGLDYVVSRFEAAQEDVSTGERCPRCDSMRTYTVRQNGKHSRVVAVGCLDCGVTYYPSGGGKEQHYPLQLEDS